MATTAIIAEILIVGLQTLAWVTIAVLAIRPDWALPTWLDEPSPLPLVLALAAAYVLGIVIDRTADSLLDDLGVKAARKLPLRKKERTPDKLRLGPKRMAIMAEERTISPFLEYQRSRLRITRSTCLNLALAIVPVGAFVARRGDGWCREWLPIVGLTAVLLIALAITFFSYVRIYKAYMSRLDDAYDEVMRGRAAASA